MKYDTHFVNMMDTNTDATTSTQQHRRQQQQQLNHKKTPIDLIEEINRLRRVVQIEKELTNSLQDVQPYILSSFRTMTHTVPKQSGLTDADNNSNNRNNNIDDIPPDVFKLLQELNDKSRINNSSHLVRVRPIPRTMEQVHAILSLGRSYSNRTSAPAGWTSTTPLIHFTTPNPLPHQLRHSALATLQLQRAVEAAAQAAVRHERTRRQLQTTKRPIESTSDTNNNNNNDTTNDDMDTSMDVVTPDDTTTPKPPRPPFKVAAVSTMSPPPPPGRPRPAPPPKTTTLLSMNLSDDDDDDDDESSIDDDDE